MSSVRFPWVTILGGVIGIVLVVFGIVWMTAIFDRFEKVPSDLDRTVELEGTYTLVDQAFLAELQGNETIQQLQAAGGIGALADDPAVVGLLSNPALATLIGSPEVLGLLGDPAAMAALSDPAVTGLLGNTELLALLRDPAVTGLLADPAAAMTNPTFAPLLANPAVASLLANPSVLGLLGDPAKMALLQNPAVATLTSQPEVMDLLTQAISLGVLDNPAVGAILADPAALSLVIDSRTQQVLANPADLPTVTVPVKLHRVRKAIASDADTLTLNERITTTNTDTGQDMGELDPRFAPSNKTLIIDRSTKEYLPGTDDGRTGQWGMPFHVKKDAEYSSWISASHQALPARYVRTEKLKGLKTYVQEVRESDVPMGADDPAGTGLPLVFDTDTVVWVEPLTGAGVNATLTDTVSAKDPAGNKYTRFRQTLVYTDDTVTRLVDDAESKRSQLVLFGTWLPWGAIVLGAVVLVISVIGVAVVNRSRGEAAA